MRKLIVGAFVSLDGVMQAPGGPDEDRSGGFEFGGWVQPWWDETLSAVMSASFDHPFALVLGRKTYDIFAAYWPKVKTEPGSLDAQVATTFNATTKYVATHSPQTLDWKNSESLGGDVVARLKELKAHNGPELLTQGSGNLIQTLLAADLIDEFRLLIFPLLLGKGKKLFDSGALTGAFKVTRSVVSAKGVVAATYARDGAVRTGSFILPEK
jgi:dihydrofolate reductase